MTTRRAHPPVLLWSAIAAYAAGFSALSVLRHRAFQTGRFDLGNMVQAVWSTAHGHPLAGDRPARRRDLAPGRALRPRSSPPSRRCGSSGRARTRCSSPQAIAVALGAVPVFWLARKHLDSERAGLGFALAYLFYPPTQWLTLNEFHPVALACPLLLFAFWYLDEDRLLPFALFALAAVTTKEEIGFVVAGLGIWYALARRRRIEGALIALAGLAVSAFAIEVVIAHFNRAGSSSFFARYNEVGGSPGGILRTAVTDPWKIVTSAFTGRGLGYLLQLLVPLGLLALLSPLVLVAAFPELAANLLSAATTQTSIRFHYTAGLIPVLVAASVLGAARIADTAPDLTAPLATAAVVLAVASNYALGAIPLWRYLPGRRADRGDGGAGHGARPDRRARAAPDPGERGRQRDEHARRAPLGAATRAQLPVHPGRDLGRRRRDLARLRGPAGALADRRPALLAAAQPRLAARLRARRDPGLPPPG